jgi:hypothetical protein
LFPSIVDYVTDYVTIPCFLRAYHGIFHEPFACGIDADPLSAIMVQLMLTHPRDSVTTRRA